MNRKSSVFITFVLPVMATLAVHEVSVNDIHSKVQSAIPWFQLAGFSAIIVNNGLQAAVALKRLGKTDRAD